MTFFDFLNVYKDKLVLLAIIVLRIVVDNTTLKVTPETWTAIMGLGAGVAIALIPHTQAAQVKLATKRIGLYYTSPGVEKKA